MKELGIVLLVAIALFGIYSDVFADVSTNAGKLLITEVVFNISGGDWVELYVVDGSINWTGYEIYKGGTLRFTIPSDWNANGLTTGDYTTSATSAFRANPSLMAFAASI